MKYLVGSFALYLIATGRWQKYADLALIERNITQADLMSNTTPKSGQEQSRDLIGGLAKQALDKVKSNLLGVFGF